MKAASFDYHAPPTVESAVALLQRFESEGLDAKVLAGGQSLMPMLNMRIARPQVLIDLGRIGALDYIRAEGEEIAIGAMTSKRAAEDSALLKARQPLFHAATRLIGHLPVRNRGTVGGSFAHADPAAEYPAVALAQDLQMKAQGPNGTRLIAAQDFFVTFMTTSLEASEVLTEVRLPAMKPGTGWSIQEFSRRAGDLALTGAVATLRKVNGLCQDTRICAFGVSATAMRFPAAEALLNGKAPTAENFARAASRASESVEEPIGDIHATPEYRRHLVKVFVGRCLAEAAGRAT